MEADQPGGRAGGGSIAGAGRKGIGLMMGERVAIKVRRRRRRASLSTGGRLGRVRRRRVRAGGGGRAGRVCVRPSDKRGCGRSVKLHPVPHWTELPLTALSLQGGPDEPTCSGTTSRSSAAARSLRRGASPAQRRRRAAQGERE